MINTIVIEGRLTKDPELKNTQNGKSYTKFTLASKRNTKDDATDFVDCVAWNSDWNHSAEYLTKYGNKGDIVTVSGTLQTNNYEYQGQNRKSVEVLVSNLSLKSTQKKDDYIAPSVLDEGQKYEQVDLSPDDLPFY